MKLAITCRYFPKDSLGGGEIYMYEIWKRASKIYETSLITGWKNNQNLLPKESYSIKFTDNKYTNYYRLYNFSKNIFKEKDFDIVNTSCPEIPVFKKQVMTMCHLGHLMGYIKKTNLSMQIQKYIITKRLKKFDKIIAISESTKSDLIKLGIEKEKISIAYPGVDYNKFKPLKTKNKVFTILYPSRISPEKGQDIAIDAIKRLPKNLNIKLQLVGFLNDKNYYNKLLRLSKDLPIEIKTNVKDISAYFRNADLIIFPTLMYEGFGIIAAEALACGKAIIASDFPAIREVIGDNGVLVPAGNSGGLSEEILGLYKDTKLAFRIGSKGRNSVMNRFDWGKAFSVHKQAYEELMKR